MTNREADEIGRLANGRNRTGVPFFNGFSSFPFFLALFIQQGSLCPVPTPSLLYLYPSYSQPSCFVRVCSFVKAYCRKLCVRVCGGRLICVVIWTVCGRVVTPGAWQSLTETDSQGQHDEQRVTTDTDKQ